MSKTVTLEQLLESARKSEALSVQIAQAAQAELEKRPTSTEVNEAMDRLFTSVSDGKSLIASAITDKGVATAADASFQTMRENILAIENGGGLPEGVYHINVSASTAEGGTVSGGGVASEGMTLTVSANVADGFNFEGWQENGEVVSADNPYTFTVTGDRTLVAGVEEAMKDLIWAKTTIPSPEYASWVGIAYGNDKFVAVVGGSNTGNTSAYSSDGITWQKSQLPYSERWVSVAYGAGKFVAISGNGGTSSIAAHSTDGITWEKTYLPSPERWKKIAYGNGKFVAVACNSSIIVYSNDGINWMSVPIPNGDVNTNLYSVSHDGNKFVAIGGYKSIHSTDGINWEWVGTIPVISSLLAYGNGRFVAAGYSSPDSVAYSDDGITWHTSTLPSSANWRDLTFGGNVFVLIAGGGSDKILYSKDGINWNEGALPVSGYWTCAGYGNSRFVVLTSGTTAAYTV